MPIVLDSMKAMREVRRLSFCYLCMRPFNDGDEANDDHIPPYALFKQEHRDFPLILRTHTVCNSGRSADDQVISQLVGLLHGRVPMAGDRKVPMAAGEFPDGSAGIGVLGTDIPGIIKRWVRGFHAALYREPLAADSRFLTSPPFPEARVTEQAIEEVPLQLVIPEFVAELKRNRATGTLDRIICRKGQCKYECVWIQGDRGEWHCLYGLDIYNWQMLGDINHFEPRGCIGWYRPADRRVPATATCGTRLHFSVENRDRLNPFGE